MGWIYAIIDRVSGKAYIGQTSKQPKYRWSDHKRYGRQRRQHPLYNALYVRPDSFEFVTLTEAPKALLDPLERDLIRLANTLYPNGYNLQEGGVALYRKTEFVRARQRGKPVSDATRAKMSANARGRQWTLEQHEKFRAAMKGRRRSPEAIEKTRLAQLGRTVSEKQKEQLRQANLGKRVSAETKAKTSAAIRASASYAKSREAMRGKKATLETRAKMSASHSTPEAIDRVRRERLGKPLSISTRDRMREGHKRRLQAIKASLGPVKTCSRCRDVLRRSTEFFSPDKRASDGLYSVCRRCRREVVANGAKKRPCRIKVKYA